MADTLASLLFDLADGEPGMRYTSVYEEYLSLRWRNIPAETMEHLSSMIAGRLIPGNPVMPRLLIPVLQSGKASPVLIDKALCWLKTLQEESLLDAIAPPKEAWAFHTYITPPYSILAALASLYSLTTGQVDSLACILRAMPYSLARDIWVNLARCEGLPGHYMLWCIEQESQDLASGGSRLSEVFRSLALNQGISPVVSVRLADALVKHKQTKLQRVLLTNPSLAPEAFAILLKGASIGHYIAALANPAVPASYIDAYIDKLVSRELSPDNRASVARALLSNPAVSDDHLVRLALADDRTIASQAQAALRSRVRS